MGQKALKLSVLAFITITASANENNTSNQGKFEGEIRLGYQYTDILAENAEEIGLSTSIKYESSSWNDLLFGTRVSGVIGNGKEPFGISFFDINNDGYGIVDELYIKGQFGNNELTIGRQELNLPFVDGDSGLGLIDNRFEAVYFTNNDIKDTTLTLAHVRSWSGVDSDDPSKFNRINGSDGMQLVGIEYNGIGNLNLQGFGYLVNNFTKICYFEGTFKNETNSFEYTTILQYALQDYEDGTKSNTFGAAFEFGLKNIPLGFNIAYNKNFDNGVADNLYGGGPFVTSMEHYTVAELEGKGDIIKGGLGYELIDGLNIEANYAKLNRSNLLDAKEIDCSLCYEYSENLGFSVIYSDIKDDQNEDMKNLRVFANYKF
jgi:hypothetical protein